MPSLNKSKIAPGRWLAFVGIVLVTLNTRAAITSLSPIYDQIGTTFSITPIAQGVLGMLPPIAFALFGWLAPRLIPRIGLEKSLLLAMILVCGGIAARSFSNSIWLFGLLFTVCLAGMGMSNVLLPPVIKVYFPGQIGLMTSIYTALVAVSASIPSLIASPVTQAIGWRFSTGIWAGLAIMAAIPWVSLIKNNKKLTPTTQDHHYPAWRWPTAWALMFIFGIGTLNLYAMVSWLPKILTSMADISPAVSGTLLSIFTAVGFAPALFVPMLLTRTQHPFWVISFFTLCLGIGYLGLAYFPLYAIVSVIAIGLGMVLVPVCLTLINLRSRTPGGAATLSGFVQGLGYLVGAVGPFIAGGLYNLTRDWMAALWFMIGTAILATIAGAFVIQPKFIEDSEGC